jgi:uncharacterized protein (DUF2384 family)
MGVHEITRADVSEILNPRPVEIDSLSSWLGMTREEVAQATGRSVRTVSRWRLEAADHAEARGDAAVALRQLGRLRYLLEDLVGESESRRWLRTPNKAFAGEAPIDLLTTRRLDKVVAVLEALADGGVY